MKILFLDVDGVLNNTEIIQNSRRGEAIDPLRLAMIHQVVKETGSKVVISSSWRLYDDLYNMFSIFLPVYDKTPRLKGDINAVRGLEIKEWLRGHPEVTKFAIVDDNPNAGLYFPKQFVRTQEPDVLTLVHAKKLLELLD